MAMDWTDPEVNPPGLKLIDQQPKNVNVMLKARAHTQFEGADGRIYICASVCERPRVVFESTENGYVEVTDDFVRLVAASWTDEILSAKVKW
jgi:hypothetical protein